MICTDALFPRECWAQIIAYLIVIGIGIYVALKIRKKKNGKSKLEWKELD